MTKINPLSLVAVLIMASILTGCAHRLTPAEEANFQTLIETERTWFQHLYANEMEAALALVSEDFASEAYPDKAALAIYLGLMTGNNILSEEALDRSKVKLKFDDTTANMGPYKLTVGDHAFSFSLDFKLEEAGWRIVGMTWARL